MTTPERLFLPLVPLLLAALFVAAPTESGSTALGADATATPADPAIESGRRALAGSVDFPWYDRQKDAPNRIDVEPPPPPSPPNSRWNFLGNLSVLTLLAWIGVAVVLALLAYFLIRTYLDRERRTARIHLETATGTEVDRIEQLPIQVRRPRGDLLGEARDHYRNGNYREAIVYLYSHLLIELDKQQLIRLARGKTNRQYLRELASRQGLRGLLEQTMFAFEDVFFGDLAISRERFEACWNRLPDFDSLLKQGTA